MKRTAAATFLRAAGFAEADPEREAVLLAAWDRAMDAAEQAAASPPGVAPEAAGALLSAILDGPFRFDPLNDCTLSPEQKVAKAREIITALRARLTEQSAMIADADAVCGRETMRADTATRDAAAARAHLMEAGERAAQVCESRAKSLHKDKRHSEANEAGKCASAIRARFAACAASPETDTAG